MFCIKCHSENTKVTNSRPHKKRASIWRRRQCLACKTTFTTIETVSTDGMLTVADNAGTSPFSISRLLISIAPLLSEQSSAPDDAYWLAVTTYEKALAIGEDKSSTQSGNDNQTQGRASELDKFKLFYEVSTTTQEERSRIKRQSRNSSR